MVTAISEQIVLDGVLEEAVWQTAPKIGNLIQREPRQGEDPTEHFWSRVFKAALVKEVARLLPSRERMAVEREWAELTRWAETSEDPA